MAFKRCRNAASSADAHAGQFSLRTLALTRFTKVTVPDTCDRFADPVRSHAASAIAARTTAVAITG